MSGKRKCGNTPIREKATGTPANSPMLSTTISNERLKRTGYIFFTDYYFKVSPVN
ncbi:MAG: hypothetical protein LBR10_02440 [Prevotellaceae bacterium]|nr:hypothetical protein [Prevotellaceae bacterium]